MVFLGELQAGLEGFGKDSSETAKVVGKDAAEELAKAGKDAAKELAKAGKDAAEKFAKGAREHGKEAAKELGKAGKEAAKELGNSIKTVGWVATTGVLLSLHAEALLDFVAANPFALAFALGILVWIVSINVFKKYPWRLLQDIFMLEPQIVDGSASGDIVSGDNPPASGDSTSGDDPPVLGDSTSGDSTPI